LPPGGRLRAGGRFQVGAESVASPLSPTFLVIIFKLAARGARRALAGRGPVSSLPPAGHAWVAGRFQVCAQSVAGATDGCGFQSLSPSLPQSSLPHSLSPLSLSPSVLSPSLPQSLFSSWQPGGRLRDASRFQVCRQPGTRGPGAVFKLALSQWLRLSPSLP